MKETFEIQLNTQVDIQCRAVVLIQSHIRCFLARHRFLNERATSRDITTCKTRLGVRGGGEGGRGARNPEWEGDVGAEPYVIAFM